MAGNSNTAQPRFHETVTLPVAGRPKGVHVVLTERGILFLLVQFFAVERYKYRSLSWQRKVCRAVGLLYDYILAVPNPTDIAGKKEVLSNFVDALIRGTIQPDGSDPTGLYWPGHSWSQVRDILGYVTLVSDYCVRKYDIVPLNPKVEASFAERIAAYRRLDRKNSQSLLAHLGNAKARYEETRKTYSVHSRTVPKVAPTGPPIFPRDKFNLLLQEGFHRRADGEPWERYNIRDMMIVILQRYGGLRESEPFHMFVGDVRLDPRNHDRCEVRLYHPESGRFSHINPLTRKLEHTTRSEYLKLKYGRVPRNLTMGKEYAGWKNLMLDVGEPHSYAVVWWFPNEWGAVFWELYQMYIRHVLPKGLNHPYLFVNLRGGEEDETGAYGEPYRISSYNNSLRRAVERIGLTYAKAHGTTSHGFRHAYGQTLEDAGVPDGIKQICLHHKSVESQVAYTQPTVGKINRELQLADERLSREGASYGALRLEESSSYLPYFMRTSGSV